MLIVTLPLLSLSMHFYPHFLKTKRPFTPILDFVRGWLNNGLKKLEELFQSREKTSIPLSISSHCLSLSPLHCLTFSSPQTLSPEPGWAVPGGEWCRRAHDARLATCQRPPTHRRAAPDVPGQAKAPDVRRHAAPPHARSGSARRASGSTRPSRASERLHEAYTCGQAAPWGAPLPCASGCAAPKALGAWVAWRGGRAKISRLIRVLVIQVFDLISIQLRGRISFDI